MRGERPSVVALWSLNQKVDHGANEVCEHNDNDPNDLGVALIRFVNGAVYQHPQPKNEPKEGHQPKREKENHRQFSETEHDLKRTYRIPQGNGFLFASFLNQCMTVQRKRFCVLR
jgi:hypothetical protein